MLAKLKSHLTYANVMATIAVFVALGTGSAYAVDTITSADIVDGEVKSVDIGDGQVSIADIGTGQVLSSRVADETLLSQDIKNGEVKSADLANGSVTSAAINNGAVTAIDLANGSITGNKLLDGTVGAADLGTNSVTSDEIQDGEVKRQEVGDDAVGSNEIVDFSVGGDDIGFSTIQSRHLAVSGASPHISFVGGIGAHECRVVPSPASGTQDTDFVLLDVSPHPDDPYDEAIAEKLVFSADAKTDEIRFKVCNVSSTGVGTFPANYRAIVIRNSFP